MVRFREKISKFYIFYFIVAIGVVTLPFFIITFSDPANLQFLPIVLVWCLFCILVAVFRFPLIQNIKLTDKFMFVPNRGYYRSPSDVRGKIRIRNGRLKIPYEEISKIKIQDGTIYLTYKSLASNVVLHPANLEKFVAVLKEKLATLNLNIPIYNEIPPKFLSEFKNEMLTNKPTLIAFSIILSLPILGEIFNVATGGGFMSLSLAVLVVIIFYVSIFAYKNTIGFSDTKLIETTKFGDIDLGIKEVAYQDIAKISKTKWRVEIDTGQNDTVVFVSNPQKLEAFYSELQKKVPFSSLNHSGKKTTNKI